MANFHFKDRHVFGTYLNMAHTNFYRTILYVFSASGIDCYTLKGDLYVTERNVSKVIDAFCRIRNNENSEEAISLLLDIVKRCYDERWNVEKDALTGLNDHQKKNKEDEFYAQCSDEGATGEKAHLLTAFTLRSEQEERLRKLLFRHIPFLAPIMADLVAGEFRKKQKNENNEVNSIMHDSSLTDCLKALGQIALCLNYSRNFYTHANPYNSESDQEQQFDIQKTVACYLDKAFVASRRIAKKRNGYSEKDLKFLTDKAPANEDSEKYRMEEVFVLDENNQKIKKVEKDDNGKIKLDKKGDPIYIYKKKVIKDDKGNPILNEKGKKQYEIVRDDKGNPIHEYETKFVERKQWYFRLFGSCKVLLPDPEVDSNKSKLGLSDFGMLYFCALFLSKEQLVQFCTEAKVFVNSPFNNDNNKKNNIILNMMYVYQTHIPRGKRLDSERDSQALAMDMLNELRRCPIELYNVLPAIGKREFEDNVIHQNSRTPELSKRIRTKDRFPHLALRYIDSQHLFEKIRFQVRLGSYRFCFYDKVCIDGKTHPRQLHKEINGFGRWQDMEKERKEQYGPLFQKTREESIWQKDENAYVNLRQLEPIKAGDPPHITDTITQYNIHKNRIGLYWNTSGETYLKDKASEQGETICQGYYLPDLKAEEIPNDERKRRKAPIDMPAPLCSLSVYDLSAMLFYQHLRKEDNLSGCDFPSAEDIIIKQYDNLVRFFKEVKDIQPTNDEPELAKILSTFGLSKQSVPKKIYDYLSGKATAISKDFNKSAGIELNRRLNKAKGKLREFLADKDKIASADNKYGKDSFASIRYAQLADYLAESIMDWMTLKLTGLNYRVLASSLAAFGTRQTDDDIMQLLADAHIYEDAVTDHPFIAWTLGDDDNPVADIETFYESYLKREIKQIEKYISVTTDPKTNKDVITLKKNPEDIPFLHRQRRRWQENTIAEQAERYLFVAEGGKEKPSRATLLLPDGLFTPYIIKVFELKHPELIMQLESLTDKQKIGITNNAAYLINLYFESKGEMSQPFYDSTEPSSYKDSIRKVAPYKFSRSYDFFNTLKGWQIHLPVDEIKKRLLQKDTLINNQVNQLSVKGNFDSLEDAKDSLKRRLLRDLRDMQDNERAIRRHKTQDRILFLMAKDIMGDTVSQNGDLFKLENVCKEEFLNQKVPVKHTVRSGDKQMVIQKEEMPIKDYGKIYRLLSDNRMVALLSYTLFANGDTINYDHLSEELKQYDLHRSSALKSAQVLENKRFEQSREVLTDPERDEFYQGNRRYKNRARTKENEAKRNNFSTLLKDLQKLTPEQMEMFSEEDRQLIIAVRNAFCHNSYPSWDVVNKLLIQSQSERPDLKLELTQIANFLITKLSGYVKQAENN